MTFIQIQVGFEDISKRKEISRRIHANSVLLIQGLSYGSIFLMSFCYYEYSVVKENL